MKRAIGSLAELHRELWPPREGAPDATNAGERIREAHAAKFLEETGRPLWSAFLREALAAAYSGLT
jgi:hypothetical protein